MTDAYTENLADFGYREIEILRDIFNAWIEKGLPKKFESDGVKAAFNRSTGNVFLVNDDYQCAMMKGDTLEQYHSLPYGAAEGFLSDLFAENSPDDLHDDDIDYLLDAADIVRYELIPPWSTLAEQRALNLE